MWHVKPWQYRRSSTALMESKKHVTSYSCSLDCLFRANNCHDDHKTTVDFSLIAKFVTDHLLYLKFLLNPFVYARRLPKYRRIPQISYVLEKHKEGIKSEWRQTQGTGSWKKSRRNSGTEQFDDNFMSFKTMLDSSLTVDKMIACMNGTWSRSSLLPWKVAIGS